uniref:UPF0317 protein C14orf159, mitochondrial n=1 Tax=Phallusia mammillata TaxID=59560 RepID=A0A6F9D7Q9_9ASCI|nr:UPF0317 protein C14orf159, mitochondrial [Phallusia mammillata]
MKKQMDLGTALPSTVRKLIRIGDLKRQATPLFCEGYKQANIVILPSSLTSDFEKFAKGNSASIPLLYTSKPGDFEAPELCNNSDIRTDVPLYTVIKNGVVETEVEHLKDFDMSNMVTFYIGCSFSFYQALIENGVTSAKAPGKNVSMYKTNVDCYPSGPFKCKMVVSMQPVHHSKLNMAADVTNCMKDVHGAPIHFGSPESIGIKDISKVDFGDATDIEEGFVPVFWCCGVTGLEALRSANVDLSFTHSPGHMFITDVASQGTDLTDMPEDAMSEVVQISAKNQQYSVVSKRTLDVLEKIAAAATKQRSGTNKAPEDFVKASLALSNAQSLAFFPGFMNCDRDLPNDVYGLLDVLGVAASLQSLGKSVAMFVEANTFDLNKAIVEICHEKGLLPKVPHLIPFQLDQPLDAQLNQERHYDVILSPETFKQKQYDQVFELVAVISEVIMISTNSKESITATNKNNPPRITADFVFGSETSDLRSCALGLAMYALQSCAIHDRYLRKAIGFPFDVNNTKQYMPSSTREKEMHEILQKVCRTSPIQTKFDKKRFDFYEDIRSMVGL